MISTKTDISFILSNLIQSSGLSISEVARRTNIPQPTVHRIVNGKHQRPHKKTLQALASFFGVTQEILQGIENHSQNCPQNLLIHNIPLIPFESINHWPDTTSENSEKITLDKKIDRLAFATKMPDNSMEPLITKNSILIIDPSKTPGYRNIVIVKLNNQNCIIVRQLIINATNYYIKPTGHDFNKADFIPLTKDDKIIGTVIEARVPLDDL